MEEMVRLSDHKRMKVNVDMLEDSREHKEMYMIYTLGNEECVTLQDYEDYVQ